MTLPNFLIVGAPKAGTGSLHEYLRQHPQIFIPGKKGLRFFAHRGESNRDRFPIQSLEEYEAAFASAGGEIARGEATAIYFWTPGTAERIAAAVPEAKIIASLREPVQRAFSIYHMNLRTHGANEGLTFLEALERDPVLQRAYHDPLKTYYDRFPPDRIKVILFEDLAKNTLATVRDLFAFLGVDPDFEPDLKISNPGGVPKSKRLHRLLTNGRLRTLARRYLPAGMLEGAKDLRSRNLDKTKMQMTEAERAGAYALFEEDIRKTQDLTGLDLSHWLNQEPEAATG